MPLNVAELVVIPCTVSVVTVGNTLANVWNVFTFPYVVPEIKDMEWNSLLDGIGFDKFLLSVLLNQKQI